MGAAPLGAMPSAWTAGEAMANALAIIPPANRYFAPARRSVLRRMVVSSKGSVASPYARLRLCDRSRFGESRQSSSTHHDNECTRLTDAIDCNGTSGSAEGHGVYPCPLAP